MTSSMSIASILTVLFCSFFHQLPSALAFAVHHRLSKSSALDQTTPITTLAAAVTQDSEVILETLKKKLDGKSVSPEEIISALDASDTLLSHLDQLENPYTNDQLHQAVVSLDIDAVDTMLASGLQMDEVTTNAAFWTVVQSINNAEENNLPLEANVTKMIHHVFEADHQHLLTRGKQTTNVTCMMPDDNIGIEGAARKMNYVFDDGDHKNLPLTEGRRCEGGHCCDKCSRNIFPTFATDAESNLETFPDLKSLTFNDLEKVPNETILQFVRLVERVRRTIAHEYGLPLRTILPLQAYSRKYVAGTTQKGGGGGEGDFVTLHTDEATHAGYHYSCVLYLSTQGIDFEGGNFVFNDPEEKMEVNREEANLEEYVDDIDDKLLEMLKNGELPEDDIVIGGYDDDTGIPLEEEIRRAGRKLTPFSPERGAAVIFSSGWENMHEVEKITSGVRYAVPCFFTTCPVPEAAYEQMVVGKPKTDEDIADDWLHLLLAHRNETPTESVGRVKELLMKWHFLCSPLSEH